MSTLDREALRAKARTFVDSPAFARHYDKQHIPAWLWIVGQLIRCLTVIGFPGGIRGLLTSRKRAFASTQLKDGYRRLVDSGRVVRGFVVINSSALYGNPKACAPALVTASLAGTDEGDAVAADLSKQIAELIDLDHSAGPANDVVKAMIADDEYRAFRKRPLPPDFTGGREVHFLDVKIDNELLQDGDFFGAWDFYFLVDPTPRGLIMQIPQVVGAVPPPLPAPA